MKNNNIKIKAISRRSLIYSDMLSILAPALLIYNFYEMVDGVFRWRMNVFWSIIIFTASILFWSQTLYEQYTVRRSFYDEFKELLHIYMYNGLAALSALFVLDLSAGKSKHIIFLVSVFFLIPFFREITRIVLNYFGLWRLECIVLCPQSEFNYAKSAIESQFNLGMKVRRSSVENWVLTRLLRKKGKVDYRLNDEINSEIRNYYKSIGSPHIIIFAHQKNANFVPKFIELVGSLDLSHSIIPDIGGTSFLGARTSHFFRWELLLITPKNNISRISYRFVKRSVDIFLSSILLTTLIIPMFVIYLVVRMDGGPGLFLHERIGQYGIKFRCIKFRTMKKNSDEILYKYLLADKKALQEWNDFHKLNNDPRVTKFGAMLRKTSLDELPQLFNILNGTMSLVGPRPIVANEIDKYGADIDIYYKARPGITGLWQISGRSNTTYDYRVSMDRWYIKNWSIWYDMGILIKTIGVVLSKVGAR